MGPNSHKKEFLTCLHSYTRLWIHLIWETLRREPLLDKRAAAKASSFLTDYALEKGIYMEINYFNAEHTHALIDLPTRYSIEEVVKLLKGIKGALTGAQAMAHFQFRILMWVASLGTLPIKKSIIGSELMMFVKRYGLEWRPEKTIKMVA